MSEALRQPVHVDSGPQGLQPETSLEEEDRTDGTPGLEIRQMAASDSDRSVDERGRMGRELNREELAWAAGFFDGEGTCGYYEKSKARAIVREKA